MEYQEGLYSGVGYECGGVFFRSDGKERTFYHPNLERVLRYKRLTESSEVRDRDIKFALPMEFIS